MKTRRNGHYGYSPNACQALKAVSRAKGEKNSLLFAYIFLPPEFRAFFID